MWTEIIFSCYFIFRFKRRSVIDPNVEKNCLPVALVFGQSLLEKDSNKRKSTILKLKRSSKKLQQEAVRLVNSLTSSPSDTGNYDLSFIQKFVKKFKNYRVVVYDNLRDHTQIRYKSMRTSLNVHNVINIFHDIASDHFFCISNLKSFFNYNHQCDICDELYNRDHKCREKCSYCEQTPPCAFVNSPEKCRDCNREFRGSNCFNSHKKFGVCDKFKICTLCGNFYKVELGHTCNTFKCLICNKNVTSPHYCYIQKYKKEPSPKYSIIFYDFESQFHDKGNGFSEHIPNICVSNMICHQCSSSSSFPTDCPNCNPFENVFENDSVSCVTKFVDYVLQFRKWPVVAIAHNSKGYDAQFILEELCKRNVKIDPILTGRKVLSIKVNETVSFIDSLSFIPLPLSKFAASFGLTNCSKGEYPYKFNTPENENYIGAYPSLEYYPIDTMSKEKYSKFIEWYNSVKDQTFNNRDELIKYCRQDVQILRAGCLNFMLQFLNTTSINPFLQAITIADAVMKVYRKNYLKVNTLAITPKNNYNSQFIHLQSRVGLKYLLHIKKVFPNLLFEYRLKNTNFIVDGFDEHTNTVFEFLGCFYHGHSCLLHREYKCSKDPQDTLQKRYETTMNRLRKIEQLGYKIIIAWECEFVNFLKSHPQIDQILNKHREFVHSSFDLRSAVYGGRTEVFKLYYKTRPGDKICYYDFTSLYPWANKYTKYFTGHPTVIKDFTRPSDILSHDGVAKCKILPPHNLYLPCLPYRCDERLLFPLCAKCCELKFTGNVCPHDDEERALIGYWSIDEIRLAVSHGYILLDSFELWSYESVKYDRNTGERGLFADYVDNFLKLKQESSGWPEDCETESAKEQYLSEYLEKEGIELNRTNISVNKGLRSLAKLMLNSLWGKFIQREDLKKTTICNTPDEMNKLLADPGIEIENLFLCGPKQVFITWSFIADCLPQSRHVSLGVGICTTSNARIALYNVLAKVGRNVLYCDTDSVIFVVPEGTENPLQTGSFLGELTDELVAYGDGSYIDEYVSTGPKAYALRIFNPSTEIYSYKVVFKGITMNRHVEDRINFDTLKSLVEGSEPIDVEYSDSIIRTKGFKLQSGPSSKKAQFTFNKRRIEGYDTLPYGY